MRSLAILVFVHVVLAAAPVRAGGLAIEIHPDCLPEQSRGTPSALALSATGGTPPYAWSVAGGALPPGLALSPGGTISGTPTATGDFAFTVAVQDGAGGSASRALALGVMEGWNIVIGLGAGYPNPNQVRAFDGQGGTTSVDFLAYMANQWGTYVAGGDVADGPAGATGHDEILTGPGPGAVYGPHARGWFPDGSSIAKVSFLAYGTLCFGVNLAGADLDGDAWDEILTGAGPGAVFGPHVRGWNADDLTVTPISKVSFHAYGTPRYGVNVASGDVEGDCIDEIETGPGPGATFAANVRAFDYDGVALRAIAKVNFVPFSHRHGAVVTTGDVESDLHDEIVVTPGPGPSNPALFVGYDYDGVAISALPGYGVTTFGTMYGGRASRASLGDPAGAIAGGLELLAAPGPDPVAPLSLAVYSYTGTGLVGAGPFTLGPSLYGANPAGVRLGY